MKIYNFITSLALALVCTTSTQAALFDVETKLTADDAVAGDYFGSVAISDNTALFGASGDDDGGSNSGSAYLFDVITGSQLAKFTSDDIAADDSFGGSVAISGNTALLGARGDDDGGNHSGSAYLFNVITGNQLAKLTADDAAERDFFGGSVAISGNTAIVGASGDDDGGSNSGSAYLFDVTTGVIRLPNLPQTMLRRSTGLAPVWQLRSDQRQYSPCWCRWRRGRRFSFWLGLSV